MTRTHNHTTIDDPPPYDTCTNNTRANPPTNSLTNHLKIPDLTLNNALAMNKYMMMFT